MRGETKPRTTAALSHDKQSLSRLPFFYSILDNGPVFISLTTGAFGDCYGSEAAAATREWWCQTLGQWDQAADNHWWWYIVRSRRCRWRWRRRSSSRYGGCIPSDNNNDDDKYDE